MTLNPEPRRTEYAPPMDQRGNTAVAPRTGGGMATAALVLGILALITSFTVIGGLLLGLLAVIFGVIGARRARDGLAPGRGRAIAGVVTGVIGMAIAIGLVIFGVSILNSPAGKNLQSCVKNANGNQAAVQQCDIQYRNSTTGS